MQCDSSCFFTKGLSYHTYASEASSATTSVEGDDESVVS